jgi:hypothetical protein
LVLKEIKKKVIIYYCFEMKIVIYSLFFFQVSKLKKEEKKTTASFFFFCRIAKKVIHFLDKIRASENKKKKGHFLAYNLSANEIR